jgi:hypothetical protein
LSQLSFFAFLRHSEEMPLGMAAPKPIRETAPQLISAATSSSVSNGSSADNGRASFLHGPVPLPWLEAAARLPGKSLHIGVALWYAAEVAQAVSIPLSNVYGLRFGVDRNAKYRALRSLERAGLVVVQRNRGRSPLVTILEKDGML